MSCIYNEILLENLYEEALEICTQRMSVIGSYPWEIKAAAEEMAIEMFEERGLQTMTTLCATGKSSLDGVTPMYLWRMRDYTYEVEAKSPVMSAVELYEDTPYEVAVKKFENMVDNMVLV